MTRQASLFDERKCPVCGRKFLLRCHPSEWGCVAQGGEYGRRVSRILLCSIPCMEKQEEILLEKSARRVEGLRSWQAWRLVHIEGRSTLEAAKMLSLTVAQVGQFAKQIDLFYWKEAAWLAEHEGVTV